MSTRDVMATTKSNPQPWNPLDNPEATRKMIARLVRRGIVRHAKMSDTIKLLRETKGEK